MKKSLIIILTIMITSCNKDYTCVCTSISKKTDIPVDHVKTTKLGSKGYKKTCLDFEKQNLDLVNCHLE